MTILANIAAAWLGFNLGLLAAAVHDYRRRSTFDAHVSDALAVVEVAQMEREPTPLADAAMDFLRRSMADLDEMQTVDDFLYLTGEEA